MFSDEEFVRNEVLDNIYKSMMQRLGLPVDPTKASLREYIQVMVLKQLTNAMNDASAVVSYMRVVEMVRALADAIELANKEQEAYNKKRGKS